MPRLVSAAQAPADLGLLHSFRAFGLLDKSLAGYVEIRRGYVVLLRFGMNAFGGTLYWSAPSGREFITTLRDIHIVTSPGIAAVAYVTVGTDSSYIKDDKDQVRKL